MDVWFILSFVSLFLSSLHTVTAYMIKHVILNGEHKFPRADWKIGGVRPEGCCVTRSKSAIYNLNKWWLITYNNVWNTKGEKLKKEEDSSWGTNTRSIQKELKERETMKGILTGYVVKKVMFYFFYAFCWMY